MKEAKQQAWANGSQKRQSTREQIAAYLQNYSPLSTHAIAIHVGKSVNTTAARLSELETEGCVTVCGTRNGYSVWRWEEDREIWAKNASIRRIEKLRAKLRKLQESPELSYIFKANIENEIHLLDFVLNIEKQTS